MKGCTYIDKDTGEPLAWTANYHSKIMQFWLNKGCDVEIIEEDEYKMQERLTTWLWLNQQHENTM